MKFWNIFTDWLDGESATEIASQSIFEPEVNPANGLPMLEGTGVDIEGNPFGTDSGCDFDSVGIGFDDCNNLSIFD